MPGRKVHRGFATNQSCSLTRYQVGALHASSAAPLRALRHGRCDPGPRLEFYAPLYVAVGQNQWHHVAVGAPPILEPILVGIGMFTGYDLDFDPLPSQDPKSTTGST